MTNQTTTFVPGNDRDLHGISRILGYRRAPGTPSHRDFLREVLEPVFGQPDAHGNYCLRLGDRPDIAFMAHHDTVETRSGNVALQVDQNRVIRIAPQDDESACLGADDGAGIWLILEMIRANRPGLYVIFADEETGRHGSRAMARGLPDQFRGITAAISLDRKAEHGNEVITHMAGRKTASQSFALALCARLGMGYHPSPYGGMTDSEGFVGVGTIRNVTNLSVGYHRAHGRKESLDFAQLQRLRDRLITEDLSGLPS